MKLQDIFKRIAERNKERRRLEMEQRAHDLITTELDEVGTLYVCVSGIRVRHITDTNAVDGTFTLPFSDMGAYVNSIRDMYLTQHGYGK